jgi:hypothetical protein
MLIRAASQTIAKRRPAEMLRAPRIWVSWGVMVLVLTSTARVWVR